MESYEEKMERLRKECDRELKRAENLRLATITCAIIFSMIIIITLIFMP